MSPPPAGATNSPGPADAPPAVNAERAAFSHAKQPGECVLTGFARALECRDEAALLHVALNNREDFYRRYAKVDAPPYGIHQVHPENAKAYREAVEAAHRQKADHLRCAVIANLIKQEWCHVAIDALFPHCR